MLAQASPREVASSGRCSQRFFLEIYEIPDFWGVADPQKKLVSAIFVFFLWKIGFLVSKSLIWFLDINWKLDFLWFYSTFSFWDFWGTLQPPKLMSFERPGGWELCQKMRAILTFHSPLVPSSGMEMGASYDQLSVIFGWETVAPTTSSDPL